MDLIKKLGILTESAKYDVACTSSGSERAGKTGMLGNAVKGGLCHSFSADGRCISLLKILLTNACIYNCSYCVNRRENHIERAFFTPEEISDLTIEFYRRNYIEGLFLSSAVVKNPTYTMELIYRTIYLLRNKHMFNGYIHVKTIPGADDDIIKLTGLLVDRMSVNIELPSELSLNALAPDKSKTDILKPMGFLRNKINESKNDVILYKNAPKFVPAGQSTQMIVGASPESDKTIVTLAENLYKKFSLKRVFYSAYLPVTAENEMLPITPPPLVREHRLYQADFLLRFYGFSADDILNEEENLHLDMDPKCQYAIKNINMFPVEVNKAEYYTILKVPGIGVRSAKRIVDARRTGKLSFEHLKKLGVVMKRAKYFLLCDGKPFDNYTISEEFLRIKLTEHKSSTQISLFDNNMSMSLPDNNDKLKLLTGEI